MNSYDKLLEEWLIDLTKIRDELEHPRPPRHLFTEGRVLAGKLTNVILEMTEDYYGKPLTGIYKEEEEVK